MIIRNQLSKTFGPVGTWAGYTLLIAGMVTIFSSLLGIGFIIAGAFMGFTSTHALIDIPNKRIKFVERFFGIIPTGKWIDIKPEMKIRIKNQKSSWIAYSWSSHPSDFSQESFHLVLVDFMDKEISALAKAESLEKAISKRDELCTKLEIGNSENYI